ncbi:hypothetical protein [Thermococcus paralvinellae]|uniref:KaiC-like domain-containing protein n=1 Tax=Thermococcus paralvinellae TaxID=582419 RepID=W0I8B4_9EURY|nr:hypothetical protein [Thermococcus paralvinellae]AHF80705.1 Hypothetical protein TES1_1325 [Thermococcus paralvinellae]
MNANPLEILKESSKRISPTLIEYEIGSEVEIVLYHLIAKLRPEYQDFIVVSFHDAYLALRKYLENTLSHEEINKIFNNIHLVSVNPVLETSESKPNDVIKSTHHDIIVGRILEIASRIQGRALFLILGLDFYGIRIGKEELIDLFPALVSAIGRKRDSNLIMTLNVKVFPQSVVEIVNSFAFNVAHLGIEIHDKDLKRYITLIRTIFLEYNLKKWYYRLFGKELIFKPANPED